MALLYNFKIKGFYYPNSDEFFMGVTAGSEGSGDITIKLSQQEAYDKINKLIEKRDKFKFSITGVDSPNKIVAYGGRGPSLIVKLIYAAISFGMIAAIMHFASPKRIVSIYFKDVDGLTNVSILSEGWRDGDSRISTFVNGVMNELMDYKVTPSTEGVSVDPLTTLKSRFAKGEITKDEFEDMKKSLE